MNEVSIIINGVRYDSVKMDGNCSICDMNNENHDCLKIASCPLKAGYVFKKSDKKFEK